MWLTAKGLVAPIFSCKPVELLSSEEYFPVLKAKLPLERQRDTSFTKDPITQLPLPNTVSKNYTQAASEVLRMEDLDDRMDLECSVPPVVGPWIDKENLSAGEVEHSPVASDHTNSAEINQVLEHESNQVLTLTLTLNLTLALTLTLNLTLTLTLTLNLTLSLNLTLNPNSNPNPNPNPNPNRPQP